MITMLRNAGFSHVAVLLRTEHRDGTCLQSYYKLEEQSAEAQLQAVFRGSSAATLSGPSNSAAAQNDLEIVVTCEKLSCS